MAKDEFIEKLKANQNVYYIYEVGLDVYGIETHKEYVVVWEFEKPSVSDNCKLIRVPEWFEMIKNCDIIPWICACLDRKFICKEYVKLLMNRDLVKLRENIDSIYLSEASVEEYFSRLVRLYLTIQILEDHKIKNFKRLSKYYYELKSCKDEDRFDKFKMLWSEGYTRLGELTNPTLEKIKLQKILNKIENEKD